MDCENGFAWVQCCRCRTPYVREAPSSQQLGAFYDQYYDEATPRIPPVVELRVQEVVASFEQFRQSGRLLDVGFGSGTLLNAAKTAGWECWGTEVSSSAVAAADPAWHVHEGDLNDLQLPADFDVICMVEVLEHVGDPRQQIAAATAQLRPGGLLAGTTPNGRGLSARTLGLRWSAFSAPEHLQLFSRIGLRGALNAAGVRSVELVTSGVNPYELKNGIRRKPVTAATRVESGYRLNASLEASRGGRALRSGVNAALGLTRTGDSLKFRAVR